MPKFFAQFSIIVIYLLFSNYFYLVKQEMASVSFTERSSTSSVEQSQCGKSSYTPSLMSDFNTSVEVTKMQVCCFYGRNKINTIVRNSA